jgi:hypothetical protein
MHTICVNCFGFNRFNYRAKVKLSLQLQGQLMIMKRTLEPRGLFRVSHHHQQTIHTTPSHHRTLKTPSSHPSTNKANLGSSIDGLLHDLTHFFDHSSRSSTIRDDRSLLLRLFSITSRKCPLPLHNTDIYHPRIKLLYATLSKASESHSVDTEGGLGMGLFKVWRDRARYEGDGYHVVAYHRGSYFRIARWLYWMLQRVFTDLSFSLDRVVMWPKSMRSSGKMDEAFDEWLCSGCPGSNLSKETTLQRSKSSFSSLSQQHFDASQGELAIFWTWRGKNRLTSYLHHSLPFHLWSNISASDASSPLFSGHLKELALSKSSEGPSYSSKRLTEDATPLVLKGLFVYRFDQDSGLVIEHRIEKVVMLQDEECAGEFRSGNMESRTGFALSKSAKDALS